jgi:hypothetical protein
MATQANLIRLLAGDVSVDRDAVTERGALSLPRNASVSSPTSTVIPTARRSSVLTSLAGIGPAAGLGRLRTAKEAIGLPSLSKGILPVYGLLSAS